MDLSSAVGFAYGFPDDIAPFWGTWHLSESSLLGPRYVAFENELIAALGRFRPGLCVAEAPLPSRPGKTTLNVARQQLGLAAYAEGECWRARVRFREQPASTARAAVLGRGRFKKGEVKGEVMAWCRAQGWNVPDDHAGDALVLLRYAHLHLQGRLS